MKTNKQQQQQGNLFAILKRAERGKYSFIPWPALGKKAKGYWSPGWLLKQDRGVLGRNMGENQTQMALLSLKLKLNFYFLLTLMCLH